MDYQLGYIRWYRADGITLQQADYCYVAVSVVDADWRLD